MVDKKFMKVSNFNILITGSSYNITKSEKRESFSFWIDDRTSNSENKILNIDQLKDKVNLSTKPCKNCQQLLPNDNLNSDDRLKILIIEELIYVLTGKRIKIKTFELSKNNDLPEIKIEQRNIDFPTWRLEYNYYESYLEKQSVTLNVNGNIITTDGKEISINFQFNHNREFFEEHHIQIIKGNSKRPIDPIVINFSKGNIEFSDKKLEFDLDGDGVREKIPFVNYNSGFLAYDINNDGQINNGTELFGPKTGNGFAELSNFDEDRNDWIDENDSIFNSLKVWTKDRNGKDLLYNLKDLNIGAIYLKHISLEFPTKNNANEELGVAKKAGVFLKENGEVGIIMHIDINV